MKKINLTTNHLRLLTIGWGILRLPVLLVLVFLFRHQIFTTIEELFDIVWITLFAISIISTPVSRLLFTVAVVAVFLGIAQSTRTLKPIIAYPVSLTAAAVFTVCVFIWMGSFRAFPDEDLLGAHWPAIFVFVILAANWAPPMLLANNTNALRIVNRIVAIAPGFGEIFFTSCYINWLRQLWRKIPKVDSTGNVFSVVPGAVLAAGCLTLFVAQERFVPLEQFLRSSPDILMVGKGDINEIVLDYDKRYLFANGAGVENVLRYDTSDWASEPMISPVDTGNGQSLAYNPDTQEIFVHHNDLEELLVLDSQSLAYRRSINVEDMSPGDSWIVYDSTTDTLTVASEADRQDGTPFVIVDRKTGSVLTKEDREAGNIFLHPKQPIIYISFFRRQNGIVAYDLLSRQVMASAPSDHRVHRMAYDPKRDEVLLASSGDSRVLRYDAQTLEPKGSIEATFGVRFLAVDPIRDYLLADSLVNGKVIMIDLSNHELLQSWYLGPWLRTIALAPERGIAYVSSNGGLYELRYANSP